MKLRVKSSEAKCLVEENNSLNKQLEGHFQVHFYLLAYEVSLPVKYLVGNTKSLGDYIMFTKKFLLKIYLNPVRSNHRFLSPGTHDFVLTGS